LDNSSVERKSLLEIMLFMSKIWDGVDVNGHVVEDEVEVEYM
jgi:hypothetical protein